MLARCFQGHARFLWRCGLNVWAGSPYFCSPLKPCCLAIKSQVQEVHIGLCVGHSVWCYPRPRSPFFRGVAGCLLGYGSSLLVAWLVLSLPPTRHWVTFRHPHASHIYTVGLCVGLSIVRAVCPYSCSPLFPCLPSILLVE